MKTVMIKVVFSNTLPDQGLQVLLTCGSNFTRPSVAAKILSGSLYQKVS